MSQSDDPYAVTKAAWTDPQPQAWELALRLAGEVVPGVAVVSTLKDFFSERETRKRLEALLDAVNEKTDALDDRISALEITARAQSEQFREGLKEASVCSLFATDWRRIERMGRALGTGLLTEKWDELGPELHNIMRTIAELGEEDIACFRVVQRVYAEVVGWLPNLNNHNAFTSKAADFRMAAAESGMHPDDFYSACKRLEGFGLAAEVRDANAMSPDEHCFRPTLRGTRLGQLLDPEEPEVRTPGGANG